MMNYLKVMVGVRFANGLGFAGAGATAMAAFRGAKTGSSWGRLGGPWGIVGGAVVGAAVGVYLAS